MVDGVHHVAGARAGVKRASRRPLSSVNSSAPPAPNTVNWSSTPMPVTDATRPAEREQHRHRERPRQRERAASLPGEDEPLGGAERRAADEAHHGERAEVGLVADQRGAGRQPDGIADGADADPGCRAPERALGGPPLDGAEAGSGERAADSAAPTASTRPPTFQPMYPASTSCFPGSDSFRRRATHAACRWSSSRPAGVRCVVGGDVAVWHGEFDEPPTEGRRARARARPRARLARARARAMATPHRLSQPARPTCLTRATKPGSPRAGER